MIVRALKTQSWPAVGSSVCFVAFSPATSGSPSPMFHQTSWPPSRAGSASQSSATMSLGTQLPAKDLLESGEVKRKFDAIDTDKSGGLDEAELLTVLNSFGQDVPAAVAANIIHLADEDGNGVIDIHEFEKIFHVLAAMEAAAGKDKK